MTFLRKFLPLALLLALCFGAVACSSAAGSAKYDAADAKEAITDLRAYIRETKGVGRGISMLADNEAVQVFTYLQSPTDGADTGEETLYLSVVTFSADGLYSYRLDLILDGDTPETYRRVFRYFDCRRGIELFHAEGDLTVSTYTGSELMSFDGADYPETETGYTAVIPTEAFLGETARDMLNLTVITLDTWGENTIDHDRDDFGFVSYNEKNNPATGTPVQTTAAIPPHLSPAVLTLSDSDILPPDASESAVETDATTDVATETQDLGPAFSSERISYALRMTLLGMGMVFAVLAILWMVLLIFKTAFGGKSARDKSAKAAKPAKEEPAPVAPAPIPAGTDPAVVAAITAAIAEMIASDPALAEQYAGGFRVVEFKRKSGRTHWNG